MTTDKPDRKPRAKAAARRNTSSAPPAPADNPLAASPPKGKIRLQRALASAGYGSRRQCEELIVEGRILVDGQIVTELGVSIDPSVQKVFVDGTPLKPRKLVYYALNKPVGVVTTNVDPEGRPRVIDLVPPDERVFPVGRLDRSSEGLILLTNDGELAQRLAHPRYEVQKVYRVTVAGRVDVETMRQMERGIHIAEGMVKVEGARVLKTRGRATEMEITLKEGKNREIRRILARLGHKVQQLKRIAIGPLRLGEMPTGAYRKLSFEELKKLKASVTPGSKRHDAADSEDTARPGAGRRPGPADGKRLSPRKGVKSKGVTKAGTGYRDAAKKKLGVKGDRASKVPSRFTDARRPPKQKAEFEISTDRIVTGSVIGADPLPPGEERTVRRKKNVKKKASTTRSFGRGGKKRPRAEALSRSAKTHPGTKRARSSRKDD